MNIEDAISVNDQILPYNKVDVVFCMKFVINDSGCWIWLGPLSSEGYGSYQNTQAHRFSYKLFVNIIPDGLTIDHLCRNPSCVNPEHLEAVTTQINTSRALKHNGNKTHCKRGHEFTPDNTGKATNGRYCKTCYRLYKKTPIK